MVKHRFIFLLSVLLMIIAATTYAAKDEATNEGEWSLEDLDAADTSGKGLDGTAVGDPEIVDGVVGSALLFDGIDDGVHLPNDLGINTIVAPDFYSDRTIACYFNCTDVDIADHKQTIFEEGGATRGFNLYVFDGEVYIGAWNRAEYNWDGAWPSVSVESGVWYHVALVLRDAKDEVESDKFEMWLNGKLVASEDGGALYGHGAAIAIGKVNADTVFHDEVISGTDVHYFGGSVDELIVYNSAFDEADLAEYADAVVSVEPQDKFTTTWAAVKAQRTLQ